MFLSPCNVLSSFSFQVAWIRVESQTILSIHTHVITRNYRITLNHRDHMHWNLNISNVQESDRGSYMCQINTVPMKKQIGYLEVVGKGKNFLISEEPYFFSRALS